MPKVSTNTTQISGIIGTKHEFILSSRVDFVAVSSCSKENHDSHQLNSYPIVFRNFTDAPYMP